LCRDARYGIEYAGLVFNPAVVLKRPIALIDMARMRVAQLPTMMQLIQKNCGARFRVMAMLIACALPGAMTVQESRAATRAETPRTEVVYVGTQQNTIHALRFDPDSGKLSAIGEVEKGLSSTWLVAHPQRSILYSVNDHNTVAGSITAFAVDRGTGALTKINTTATEGYGTTYLWLDQPSMTFITANYASGSVSNVLVNQDGSLGPLVSKVSETGSGPSKRQKSAHAHSAAVDPSGRYALVPDLGADRVFIYRFDRATHALSQGAAASGEEGALPPFIAPPGSGPRHLAFGATGKFVYLLTEMSADIMVLRWDAAHGNLTFVQSLPISSSSFSGTKSGAEVAVSRDGRFVYIEDRGENSLVVYRVSPDSGELSLVQRLPSGGDRPWAFAIDSSGKWMFVDNQRSGSVNVFRIDRASGRLSDTGQSVSIPSPVSIAFVR
jgi:6-phosphogluconolactonase